MNEIVIPLVSPLSRKYYAYASEKSEHKHHRAEDVRICLEYICDHIIYIFVSEEDKEKWKKYKLDKKIKASRSFLDDEIVNKLLSAKCIGNAGVHEGEEGNYSEQDIVASLVVIREFSLRIFYDILKSMDLAILKIVGCLRFLVHYHRCIELVFWKNIIIIVINQYL